MKFGSKTLAAVAVAAGLALTATPALADDLYRVYDTTTGEHLYTSHMEEVTHLQDLGWNWEKDQTMWIPSSGTPVWRVYNPTTGDHHYTSDRNEFNVLTGERGWVADFSGDPAFYGATKVSGTPVYRIYDTKAAAFGHLFTKDTNERDTWLGTGTWNDEGIGWYELDPGFKDDAGVWHVDGDCWVRKENGTLYVRPADLTKNEGTLGAGQLIAYAKGTDTASQPSASIQATRPPEIDESITAIKSCGTIHMNQNGIAALAGMPNVKDFSTVADWDTSGVTNMYWEFYGDEGLTDLKPLAGWDTSKVQYMGMMFMGCKNLTDVKPIAGWDVSQVTVFSKMFNGASSLKDATALNGWKVADGASMEDAFQDSGVTGAGLPSWYKE